MILANILGNLGKDAEIKNINGKEYLSFSVASTEKKGESESTTWISVLSSNTNLLPYLKKGQQVFVSGRLSASIYQSQQSVGIDLSVFAQTMQLCGGKREESQQTQVNVMTGDNAKAVYNEAPQQPQQTVIYPDREPTPVFPPAEDEDNGLPF